jgi:hypothetical protein
MTLPVQFTRVTRLSKTLAFIVFIGFPFLGFWFGTKYQAQKDTITFGNELMQVTQESYTAQKTQLALKESLDWKTYSNKEYGFTFMYPQDLQLDVKYPTKDQDVVVVVAKPNTEQVERVWIGMNSSTDLYGTKIREEKIGPVTWMVTKYQECNGMYCENEVISYETFHDKTHYIINGDFVSPQLVLYTFKFVLP